MKKILAMVLIVVVLVGSTGLAESKSDLEMAKILKVYAGEMLEKSLDEYKGNKNAALAGDYIYRMYCYYEMYGLMSSLVFAEQGMELAKHPLSMGKSPMIETSKETESAKLLTDEFIYEQWKLWLKGDISDDLFGAVLSRMAEVTVKNYRETGK